jgi:Family of unknown function (DUF6461)
MWLDDQFGGYSYCLTFVRGCGQREVMAAFGADPGAAVLRTLGDAEWAEQRWEDGYGPFVRVGRAGDWLFAWEVLSAEGMRPEVARRVSAGGQAVTVQNCIGSFAGFSCAEDGEVVTSLVTIVPYTRGGRDPDRFLPLIRDVGLDFEAGQAGPGLSDLRAVLTVAERPSGIALTRCGSAPGPAPGPS